MSFPDKQIQYHRWETDEDGKTVEFDLGMPEGEDSHETRQRCTRCGENFCALCVLYDCYDYVCRGDDDHSE